MRLYEFEGKQLFSKFKIPVMESHVVSSPDEVYQAVSEMNIPVVLKTAIHGILIYFIVFLLNASIKQPVLIFATYSSFI